VQLRTLYIKCTRGTLAETSTQGNTPDTSSPDNAALKGLMNNQIRIARLRLLLIAAKVVYHSKDKVKYSIHDTRTPGLMHFLEYLDKARSKDNMKRADLRCYIDV